MGLSCHFTSAQLTLASSDEPPVCGVSPVLPANSHPPIHPPFPSKPTACSTDRAVESHPAHLPQKAEEAEASFPKSSKVRLAL